MAKILTKQLNVGATPELLRDLQVASKFAEIPLAQIVREGAKEKISELAKKNPKLRAELQKQTATA